MKNEEITMVELQSEDNDKKVEVVGKKKEEENQGVKTSAGEEEKNNKNISKTNELETSISNYTRKLYKVTKRTNKKK